MAAASQSRPPRGRARPALQIVDVSPLLPAVTAALHNSGVRRLRLDAVAADVKAFDLRKLRGRILSALGTALAPLKDLSTREALPEPGWGNSLDIAVVRGLSVLHVELDLHVRLLPALRTLCGPDGALASPPPAAGLPGLRWVVFGADDAPADGSPPPRCLLTLGWPAGAAAPQVKAQFAEWFPGLAVVSAVCYTEPSPLSRLRSAHAFLVRVLPGDSALPPQESFQIRVPGPSGGLLLARTLDYDAYRREHALVQATFCSPSGSAWRAGPLAGAPAASPARDTAAGAGPSGSAPGPAAGRGPAAPGPPPPPPLPQQPPPQPPPQQQPQQLPQQPPLPPPPPQQQQQPLQQQPQQPHRQALPPPQEQPAPPPQPPQPPLRRQQLPAPLPQPPEQQPAPALLPPPARPPAPLAPPPDPAEDAAGAEGFLPAKRRSRSRSRSRSRPPRRGGSRGPPRADSRGAGRTGSRAEGLTDDRAGNSFAALASLPDTDGGADAMHV